ncbi:MAG: hypothetical protein COA49_05780 [Bacteroidetes bacterium]|nr:MAG: hypothetical protein COA49_05780 [Bacteroidota bacterium]
MKNFTLLFLYAAFFCSIPVAMYSQVVNVEKLRQDNTSGLSGKVEFNFTARKTTVQSLDWRNQTFLQWDNEKWSVLLLNEINFNRVDGTNYVDDGFQHLRISRHLNDVFTAEAYGQNQYDPVRNIAQRRLLGAGVRVKLSNSNYFGFSTLFENELLTDETLNQDFRLSSYLQLKLQLSKTIKFLTTTYLQPNLSKFSDIKISSQSTLSFHITDKFAFTNSFTAIYDSFPATGIPSFIYNFRNGIKYLF